MRKYCPKCGGTFTGKRCPCTPRPKRKPTQGDTTRQQREPWRNRYGQAPFRAARQEAIERTKGRCTDCGKQCARYDGKQWRTAEYGGEVDHIVALCDGGTDSAENLALRCKSCHAKRDAARRRNP